MSGTLATSRSGWMVSPGWDLAFIIASPVVIVPALWLFAHSAVTPEQLAVPVFAFATLGHHLPGYMRAYGDRELFARFRMRFVVVPPVLFGVVLFLVAPSLFGAAVAPPSSLQLLLVVWGAWHGLMQIYGFMRIYDAKQGGGHGLTQRLDLAVCFAIFAAGFLFSDSRMFVLMDLGWRAGFPAFGPGALETARLALGVLLAGLVVAYGVNLRAEARRGRRSGGVKLLLALATGGIYTFSGLITTDILLGAAAFEIFHAVQYLAIVWYFNRRLESRVGGAFGPLRFLFRDRWSSLALYLLGIAAFGAIFLTLGTPGYGPIRSSSTGSGTLYLVFSAFFVTSSLLHYYYDGFIWKLHDRDTASTLGVGAPGLSEISVPAVKHFAKWAALALLVGATIGLEVSQPASAEHSQARLHDLAALTPDVPELQAQLVFVALEEGRISDALAMAEQSAALRPRSHTAHANLGRVRVALEDWPGAEAAYRTAEELLPGSSVYRTDLARVIARQGDDRLADAAAAYREALAAGGDPALERELAEVLLRSGEPAEAVALLEPLLAKSPAESGLRERLAMSLHAAGDADRALEVAQQGTLLFPDSAPAHRGLGTLLVAMQRPSRGADALERARDLDPALPAIDLQLGEALFDANRYWKAAQALERVPADPEPPAKVALLLGIAYAKTGRPAEAHAAWEEFVARAPDLATGHRTLGARLDAAGLDADAEAAYREALKLEPGHAATQKRLAELFTEGAAEGAARAAQ